MLSVEKVSIQYGGRTLFSDLSLMIRANERMSLAGPNGAGKSTLLKIIHGLEQPDSGKIVKARQVTVGYLPQEGVHHEGQTLFAEVETAFADTLQLKQQLGEVEAELDGLDPQKDEEKYANALEVFGDLQLRLEHHDISRMKPRIETVLGGLGFSHADHQRQTGTFSGGWQMRIALAKLLLQEPSVLLLDEPTNHLDIETIQWLEQWLRNYGGAVILISHDRTFLDNLTNRTLAFDNGRVEHYAGNFSFYLQERDARREQLERAARNQAREIEKAEQLINRFRAKATKAKMVQSRIKQLEKVERIELEDSAATIGFRFPQPERSGHSVVRLEGICKHYGENRVIDNFDFEITRGDRIAIVGVNGAGKSTFSRLVSDVEEPTSGVREFGHKVAISHFSQTHADELDPKKTVLETIEATARRGAAGNLRTLLGAFLFRGDDVFKQVSVLSGGERGRLALARMLLQPANFLILDEPTNHLDMQSQEVLQNALLDYSGTYLIVSHNRSFLDPVVTKVLEFIPGQPPRLYYGNVSDYLEKKAADQTSSGAPSTGAKPSGGNRSGPVSKAENVPSGNRKEQRRLEAQRRQQLSATLKPLKAEFEELEASIESLESEKAGLGANLADPEFFKTNTGESAIAAKRFHEVETALASAYTTWTELSDKIERIESHGQ